MCDYYFDEDHGIAYKINPIMVSVVHNGEQSNPETILVRTDVKVTNYRKEKVRRTLSVTYPSGTFDPDTAKKTFRDTLLSRFISGAKRISEQEYLSTRLDF
ncbi:MAG: hypothetical protein ACOY4Q_06990 [Bacillota bacterium]